MKILVTGSSGHLGEALIRTLRDTRHAAIGVDILASPFTTEVGSIVDRSFVRRCMQGVDAVLHAATLHKPHVATHARRDFVDVNITGTLNLLEEAAAANVGAFIFTSTTSTFGDALRPPVDAPAVWVTEDVVPQPKNIYGVTKLAAENLCELFRRKFGLPCLVLRTSRFFPEEDDGKAMRATYADANAKANEFLYRRVDIADVVDAHLLAIEKAAALGFRRYIISATTPFTSDDLSALRGHAADVVKRHFPTCASEYARRDWQMFADIERVYVNELARCELGWRPRYDFAYLLDRLRAGDDFRSPLAQAIGAKGYHEQVFAEGPYPIE
ncbi:MAG: NAD-dependent epimerase/dehydratase family protein [Rudaea sp.]